MIKVIDKRTDELVKTLLTLWDGSVRPTHTFLTEEDIAKLHPLTEEMILNVERLAVIEKDQKIVGFIGVQNNKIEMLFIDKDHFKKGYGKKLINYGIKHFDAKSLTVNENNVYAKAFYERLGFKVYARHETDPYYGMSFPILDMKL